MAILSNIIGIFILLCTMQRVITIFQNSSCRSSFKYKSFELITQKIQTKSIKGELNIASTQLDCDASFKIIKNDNIFNVKPHPPWHQHTYSLELEPLYEN